jgi:hypothetical protein
MLPKLGRKVFADGSSCPFIERGVHRRRGCEKDRAKN